jgi:N-acetylmuramoyl-L-alanine amidase
MTLDVQRPDTLANVDHIIIHCSATGPTQDVYSLEIDRWHRKKGWFGNGYHFVLPRDGGVEEYATGHRCRPLNRAGAHVGDCGPGWNGRSIGICMIGGVDAKEKPDNNFTVEQWWYLERLVPELIRQYPKIQIVLGHRDLIKLTNAPPKACPSFDVEEWWRTWVMARPRNNDLIGVRTIGTIK